MQIVILPLAVYFASVAARLPPTEPPHSNPKPIQINTPNATILIDVNIMAVDPAPTYVPTAMQAHGERQKLSSQKSPTASTRNPSNLSSENSTEPFSDNLAEPFRQNSTTQLRQNFTKESRQNATEQFDQKLTNLSSQYSTKQFKQNSTKASSAKSQQQPSGNLILKPYQIYRKNLPLHVLSQLPNYGRWLGFAPSSTEINQDSTSLKNTEIKTARMPSKVLRFGLEPEYQSSD